MMVWSDKTQQKLYLTLFNSQPFCNQRTVNGKSFEADSDADRADLHNSGCRRPKRQVAAKSIVPVVRQGCANNSCAAQTVSPWRLCSRPHKLPTDSELIWRLCRRRSCRWGETMSLKCASNGSTLHPSSGIWVWSPSAIRHGKPTTSETCPSATLSTTSPTCTGLVVRGERPATNRLSHGNDCKVLAMRSTCQK
jgi:hypothetical protein